MFCDLIGMPSGMPWRAGCCRVCLDNSGRVACRPWRRSVHCLPRCSRVESPPLMFQRDWIQQFPGCCQVGNCRSSKNRNRSVWLRSSRCQMMPLSRCVRKCCVALVPKYWFWRQIFLMPASNTVVRYCCCLGHPSGPGSSSPAAAGTGPRCGLGLLFPSGRP